jgi:predicted amidohydrolase YtcJ
MRKPSQLTRSEFLKLSAAAAASAAMAKSGLGRELLATDVYSAITPPDLILAGGKVATMDASNSTAQAVAVKNGVIVQVGADSAIRALAGPSTRLIELKGRTVTPGFVDPHNHFQVFGQIVSFYVPFVPPEITNLPDLVAKLRDIVALTPPGDWVVGYYLTGELPDRYDFDAVSPANPVFIMQQAGHFGIANSKALQIAGITSATPSPQGGIIEKDTQGIPTGVLYNHRAMDLVRKFMPQYPKDVLRDAMVDIQPLYAASGITSYQDNNIRGVENIQSYQELNQAGRLYLRNTLYFTLEYPGDLDPALHQLDHYQDDFTRIGGYKFLIDGQATTFYCHAQHNGVSWNMPTWDPTQFKQAVRQLHDAGGQICVHCGGDASTDLVLDAYEEAQAANPRPDARHRIEHAVLTTQASVERIKELGVVMSVNPTFTLMSGDYWFTVFGTARVQDEGMRVRDWLNAGIPVCIGSDTPTTPWFQPQATLWSALTRQTQSKVVIGPQHIMTIAEALKAHTYWAAYAGHEEAVKGSIEAGKYADLVVWRDDPYTATLKTIQTLKVDLTLVGGEVVYRAPSFTARRHLIPS